MQPDPLTEPSLAMNPEPTEPMQPTEPDYVTARKDLAQRIAERGWSIDSEPGPRPKWAEDKPGRQGDTYAAGYRFTLTAPNVTHTGTYSVGSVILAQWAAATPPKSGASWNRWDRKEFALYRTTGRGLSLYLAEQFPAVARAYRPDIVDVVASMLMDVSGYEPEATFREWLANSGMDWSEANPADALETFEAIRAEARFLYRALGADTLAEWTEIASRL